MDNTTQSERHSNLQVRKFNILREIMFLLVPKKIDTQSMVKIKLSLILREFSSLHGKIFLRSGVWVFFATMQYSKV